MALKKKRWMTKKKDQMKKLMKLTKINKNKKYSKMNKWNRHLIINRNSNKSLRGQDPHLASSLQVHQLFRSNKLKVDKTMIKNQTNRKAQKMRFSRRWSLKTKVLKMKWLLN